MRNRPFQRKGALNGFKDLNKFDMFIQKAIDLFYYSEIREEINQAVDVYGMYLWSDKQGIPDLVIYNEEFNKNDCFMGYYGREYNKYPRVKFVWGRGKAANDEVRENSRIDKGKEKDEAIQIIIEGNLWKKDCDGNDKENENEREEPQIEEKDEDESEDLNNEAHNLVNPDVFFQHIQENERNIRGIKNDNDNDNNKKNTDEDLHRDINKGNETETVVQKENLGVKAKDYCKDKKKDKQWVIENTTIEVNSSKNAGIIINENKQLPRPEARKQQIPTKKIITRKQPQWTIEKNQEISEIQNPKIPDNNKPPHKTQEISDRNPQNLGNPNTNQQNQESSQEKMAKEPWHTPYNILWSNNKPTLPVNTEAAIMNPDHQIPKAVQNIKEEVINTTNNESQNTFIPNNLPRFQPFHNQMLPPFIPINPILPIQNSGIINNYLTYPSEDEDDNDPIFNNFNEDYSRYNASMFLEKPVLIVKKNWLDANWFLMKGTKIWGNFNSEDWLYYLGDQICRGNHFDNMSISDYPTDVFFKPTNWFDILKKNVPKLKRKYMLYKNMTQYQMLMQNMQMQMNTKTGMLGQAHNQGHGMIFNLNRNGHHTGNVNTFSGNWNRNTGEDTGKK